MAVIAGLGAKGWELVTATDAVSPSEPVALRHVRGFGRVAGPRTQRTGTRQTRRPVPVKQFANLLQVQTTRSEDVLFDAHLGDRTQVPGLKAALG